MILRIISPILIIIGWFVVYKLNRLEKSKDDRSDLIRRIESIADDVELMAIEYHTELKKSNKVRILLNLTNLSREIDNINNNNEIINAFIGYRQAITSNNFDGVNLCSYDFGSELVRNIGISKEFLIKLVSDSVKK